MAATDFIIGLIGYEDLLVSGTQTQEDNAGTEITVTGMVDGGFCHKDHAHQHDEDFTVGAGYTLTVVDDADLGTAAGAELTPATGAGASLVVGASGVAGTTAIYHDVSLYGDLTLDSGTTLTADDLTLLGSLVIGGDVSLTGTFTGAVSATGAWVFTGGLDASGACLVASGSGNTLRVGNAGAAASTAVAGFYGKTTFNGNVVALAAVDFSGASSVTLGDAIASSIMVDGALDGSQALQTTSFYAGEDADFGGDINARANLTFNSGAYTVQWSSGLSALAFSGNIYGAGNLTIAGNVSIAGTLTYEDFTAESNTISDYLEIEDGADVVLNPVTLTTISATLDISNKNFIIVNDSTGSGTNVTAVTSGGRNKMVRIVNMGTDYLIFDASLMASGSSYTIAASDKAATLFWNESTSKFYVLGERS